MTLSPGVPGCTPLRRLRRGPPRRSIAPGSGAGAGMPLRLPVHIPVRHVPGPRVLRRPDVVVVPRTLDGVGQRVERGRGLLEPLLQIWIILVQIWMCLPRDVPERKPDILRRGPRPDAEDRVQIYQRLRCFSLQER